MVVRMRHTRSHTKNRRSHHKLTNPAISKEESGALHLRHRASLTTGMYRGRKVMDVVSRVEKLSKKTKERETAKTAK